jgi:tetratricopeptide (TPR) repeat protein
MIRYEALAQIFPADLEIRRNLSLTYNQNGVVLARAGKMSEALPLLNKGLAMRQACFSRNPTPQAQEDLSFAYSDLGLFFSLCHNHRAALEQYRRALDLRSRMAAADRQNVRVRRFLALSYGDLAQEQAVSGRFRQAVNTYRNGVTILAALSALDQANAVLHTDLARFYSELGAAFTQQARSEIALTSKMQCWRDALVYYKQSQTEWHSLQRTNTLFGADAHKPVQADRAVQQCEIALVQLRLRAEKSAR